MAFPPTYTRVITTTIPTGVDGESPNLECDGDEVPSLVEVPADWAASEINLKVSMDGGTTWSYIMTTNTTRTAMIQSMTGTGTEGKSSIPSAFVSNPCLFLWRLVSPNSQGSTKTVKVLVIKRARL